tara:strand:+ start:2089 stop:2577 length:489 start_codon:yes stop_codon:yes gene_type:complete
MVLIHFYQFLKNLLMLFEKVKKGVYFCNSINPIANDIAVDFLIKTGIKENLNILRLCLHESEESKLMTMLIVILNQYLYPPHRHSWKDESYTIIKGECIYKEYDCKGKIISHVKMKEGDTLLNCHGKFHTFVPLSDKFIFVENTIGPFSNQPLEFLKDFESN